MYACGVPRLILHKPNGLVATVAVLAGCGDVVNLPNEGTAGCTVYEELGDLGALRGAVASQIPQQPPTPPGNDDAKLIFLRAPLTDNDALEITLWDSYGAFGDNDVTTGKFSLTGVESNDRTCGLCVRLFGNIDAGMPLQRYIATGGSITLTSVTGKLVGSASDLTFAEIAEGSTSGDTLPDGCMSTAAKFRFDVMIGASAR